MTYITIQNIAKAKEIKKGDDLEELTRYAIDQGFNLVGIRQISHWENTAAIEFKRNKKIGVIAQLNDYQFTLRDNVKNRLIECDCSEFYQNTDELNLNDITAHPKNAFGTLPNLLKEAQSMKIIGMHYINHNDNHGCIEYDNGFIREEGRLYVLRRKIL